MTQKMSFSERHGFYKPGSLHPRKKRTFSEEALSEAEEEFQRAVQHWDRIDWSRKSAREAGSERNKLFAAYMKIQKLAMAKGGPSPSGAIPGGYLAGFHSQYGMRINDPHFLATGVSVGAPGSPAHERQKELAAARKLALRGGRHERGDNPRTARSKPKAHGRKPQAGGSGIHVGAGLKKKIDGVLGRRK
jgi:hypothetical protein